MANVAIEKVWKVALDTGANVLALTVTEAAASSERMDQKRSILNSFIKHHQHERLYVSFPSLASAEQSVPFDSPLNSDSQGTSYVCDLYSKIPYAKLDEAARERLWDDGLHLTEVGYNLMGEVIAERLFEILREEGTEIVAPTSSV